MFVKTVLCLALCLLCLPASQAATIHINTADTSIPDGDDGLCTLAEAIDAVNNNLASGLSAGECVAGDAHPVVDVIEFDVSILPAVFLTFETYLLSESVHINGPAKELVTFTGIGLNRVLEISNLQNDAEFIIDDLTFANTTIRLPEDYGGAIWAYHINGASLSIERCDFLLNTSERGGGAIGLFAGFDNTTSIKDSYFANNIVNGFDQTVAGGGAIFIGGRQNVTIENSTFENNTVTNLDFNNPLDDAAGGAILVRANGETQVSSVSIRLSTFDNNNADGVGGAIATGGPGYPLESSELMLRHNTFTNNTADFNSDQTGTDSGGGALYAGSSAGANLFNNVIAGNQDNAQSSAPDLAGGFITLGNNLISNSLQSTTTFPIGMPNINDDFVGLFPVMIDPMLEPIADNGGPTPTRLPQANSPVLDQGKCPALIQDQRHRHNDLTGMRITDQPGITDFMDGCDIGAVELDTTSNDPIPLAVADSFNLLEGDDLLLTAINGVLANDVDDDALVVVSAGSLTTSAGDAQGQLDLMADGALLFQADDADGFGLTTFDYTISDGYNTSTVTSEIIIQAVNDAPFYTASATTITADAGIFTTINDWADNISPGPANEAAQQVIFVVDVSGAPNGFFSGFPAIDPISGQLSFELAAQASGQGVVDITIRDDGGTNNGGQNEFTRSITFVVSDVVFADGFE